MPTDDPTDPIDDPKPGRRRVTGAQIMEAIDRLADRVGGGGGDDDPPDDGPLPPEVTFEPEDEPVPNPDDPATQPDIPPTPPTDSAPGRPARKGGFPRRRR